MVRTRSKDYENIQASILDNTAALFAERGYAATSIGDIAQACDCSKSRLYHYFENKEDILAEMLSEHIDVLLEGCHDALAKHADPVERFRVLVRFFMGIYAVSSDKHAVLLTCIRFLPEETRQTVLRKERELVTFIRDIIARIRPDIAKNGQLAHIDTMLFFGMINWTYTWFKADGPVTPEALADRAVDLFLGGYRELPA
ncbi:TetR/AcrR family transcriptional regulator [uncultured Roseibium sp.]|uniref:TetR/AcrR family transcriptional regulator n=1 Tax=uncultured Roseibium sp. TaxID=1936171 RepID=UPI0032162C6B